MSELALERLREWEAGTAIVLGSGLGSLVGSVSAEQRVACSEFEELPRPAVDGHDGQFAFGTINEHRVIYAQGRVHLYEGHSAVASTAGIRLLADAGLKRLILTNAAGSTNRTFQPGEWMMIRDHLNLTGATPLLGGPSFVDMTDVYSQSWRTSFKEAATTIGITLHEGVYAGVLGPQYETPAEVQMIRQFGADAIGMSTVLEAMQAHALGLQVAAFSCLTNWAAGMGEDHLNHADVLKMGKAAAADLARLLAATL